MGPIIQAPGERVGETTRAGDIAPKFAPTCHLLWRSASRAKHACIVCSTQLAARCVSISSKLSSGRNVDAGATLASPCQLPWGSASRAEYACIICGTQLAARYVSISSKSTSPRSDAAGPNLAPTRQLLWRSASRAEHACIVCDIQPAAPCVSASSESSSPRNAVVAPNLASTRQPLWRSASRAEHACTVCDIQPAACCVSISSELSGPCSAGAAPKLVQRHAPDSFTAHQQRLSRPSDAVSPRFVPPTHPPTYTPPSRQTDAVSVRAPAGPRDAPPTSSVSCAPVVYASTATWQGQALLRTGLLDRPTRAEPQQVDIMYTPTIDPIRSGFFCLFVVRPTRSPCMCVYARARVLQLQP